jgi:hypothetical protein
MTESRPGPFSLGTHYLSEEGPELLRGSSMLVSLLPILGSNEHMFYCVVS